MFSFANELWELLTGRVPYSELTPAGSCRGGAKGPGAEGPAPQMPLNMPPALAELMQP